MLPSSKYIGYYILEEGKAIEFVNLYESCNYEKNFYQRL